MFKILLLLKMYEMNRSVFMGKFGYLVDLLKDTSEWNFFENIPLTIGEGGSFSQYCMQSF